MFTDNEVNIHGSGNGPKSGQPQLPVRERKAMVQADVDIVESELVMPEHPAQRGISEFVQPHGETNKSELVMPEHSAQRGITESVQTHGETNKSELVMPEHSAQRGISESVQSHGETNKSCPSGKGGILRKKGKHTVLVYDIQQSGCLPKLPVSRVLSWSISPLDIDEEIKTHNLVISSGQYNFQGCRIPVTSNLNIPWWRQELEGYSDSIVSDFCEFGWPIGYEAKDWPISALINHKGAKQYPDHIDGYFQKEISLGATMGPFGENPFDTILCISPLNSVPKEGSERRIIVDLSFPQGAAVNDGIPKESYLGRDFDLQFPTVDRIGEMIRSKGQGSKIFKRDLSRAYRQLPIDPGDYHFLGMAWGGLLFVDRVPMMGLRSAALMCQRTTSAIVYVLKKHNISVENYLDDLFGVEFPDKADWAYNKLGEVIAQSGLKEKPSKACSPATEMVCIGVNFNTQDFSMSVSKSRLNELESLLQIWSFKSEATKKELESFLGKLMFVCKCVRQSRVFVSRLLWQLRSLGSKSNTFRVDRELLRDIEWWQKFLRVYNGVSIIPDQGWSSPDQVIATDACLQGGGGVNQDRKEFFHFLFPPGLQECHINLLELVTVVIAIKIWGCLLKGKKILIRCDNLTTVQVISTGRCRDPQMLVWLRELCYYTAIYECVLKAVHIEGAQNRLPDLLSRWSLGDQYSIRFNLEVGEGWKEVAISEHVFQVQDSW